MPHATSLRMSDLGYQNSVRSKLQISTNTLADFIKDIDFATKSLSKDFQRIYNKPNPEYSQINPNVLQIDDEFYAVARPKSAILSNDRLTAKLLRSGVDFIELRSLDLNPFSKVGIDLETVYFIEVLFIFCMFQEDTIISKEELKIIESNDYLVAIKGREPNLYLSNSNGKILLKDWGKQILSEMLEVAKILDEKEPVYTKIINKMMTRVNHPELTLSGLLIEKILSEKLTYNELGNSIGEMNKEYFKSAKKPPFWSDLERESQNSIQKQLSGEIDCSESFESFKDKYFSI